MDQRDMTSIEPIYAAIGRRLRDERLTAGWTQDEVAGWVGLTRASIANVETGRQRLMLHQLITYADVLSVPLGELIGSSVESGARQLREDNARLRRRVAELETSMQRVSATAQTALEKAGD